MKWNENDVWNIYRNPIIVQAVGLSSYNAKKPQAKYLRFPVFKVLFLKMFLIFHSVGYQRFFQEVLLHEQHLHR